MTGSDDEHDDDPQLRSLRAVWLAMPDEEPPERGLSELMAAARHQAAVMAEVGKPPWWRRALVQLMRPPVLALATVMILLGGAVLVTSSKKAGVSSEPAPVESAPRAKVKAADVPAATPSTAAGSSSAQPSASDPSAAGGAAPPVQPELTKHAAPAPKSIPRPAPKPAAKTTPAPALETSTPDRGGFASPPPPPAPAAAPTPSPAKADDGDDEAPATRGPVTRDAKKANDDQPPRQQLVDQLLAQCRAATTRGDCESAKLIAKRIAAADAAFYAAHVSSDAAIAKCLAN